MITNDQAAKLIQISTDKMMIPFDRYLNKQTKRFDLQNNEVLTVALSTLVNVFVKSIMLIRIILAQRDAGIEVNKIIDHIASETKKHFEKLEPKQFQKKMLN